jgi:hypothetical protein
MPQSHSWQWIPTHFTLEQFNEFVLPYLPAGSRGSGLKLSLHEIFNFQKTRNQLKVLAEGLDCRWAGRARQIR